MGVSRELLIEPAGALRGPAAVFLTATIFLSGCGSEPHPGSPRLYITSGLGDEVLALDPHDGRVLERFPLDVRRDEVDEPHGIAVGPDGRHWYATVAHGNPSLWKFELPDDRLVGMLPLGSYGAARIGLTPDGRRGFIPDYHRSGQGAPSGVSVVDLFDLSIVAQPTLCPAPHDAQVDPTGRRVAIACSLSDEIVLLDARTLEKLGRFEVGSEPGPAGEPRYKPLNLVWSPDGSRIYVTLFLAGEVRAYGPAGDRIERASTGLGPAQLAISRDGSLLVVANRNDASVSLLQTAPLSESARVRIDRPHPHGIALRPDSRQAFVTYEGDTRGLGGVVAIDLVDREVLWSVEAGVYTLGIAYYPPPEPTSVESAP